LKVKKFVIQNEMEGWGRRKFCVKAATLKTTFKPSCSLDKHPFGVLTNLLFFHCSAKSLRHEAKWNQEFFPLSSHKDSSLCPRDFLSSLSIHS
jgi:hypothetical protein